MSLSLSWLIPSASDVGTSIYKAPETFLGGEYDLKKSDIFSMGISILQIISDYNLEHESEVGIPGVLLLQNPDFLHTLINYIPSFYSEELKTLLTHILDPNPATRYSTKEILAYPTIQKEYWEEESSP